MSLTFSPARVRGGSGSYRTLVRSARKECGIVMKTIVCKVSSDFMSYSAKSLLLEIYSAGNITIRFRNQNKSEGLMRKNSAIPIPPVPTINVFEGLNC